MDMYTNNQNLHDIIHSSFLADKISSCFRQEFSMINFLRVFSSPLGFVGVGHSNFFVIFSWLAKQELLLLLIAHAYFLIVWFAIL